MATTDKKITDLPALTTADTSDVMEIVDVSANVSKQVAVSGLGSAIASSLPAGGVSTAALADGSVTNAKLAPELGGEWATWTPIVTGFSGTPTVSARYVKIGRLVTLYISLSGTSNAVNATFTVPVSINVTTSIDAPILTGDASANYWGVCYIQDANTLQVRRGGSTPFSTFATSGTKTIIGVVTYEAAS